MSCPKCGFAGVDGVKLKKLRLEKGWTLEFLARLAGVSTSLVSLIENSRRPGLHQCRALAEVLGVSLDDLEVKS